LDEFIDTLPEGLETMVGERGVKLSGGQRQRLGIARALVREAPIIIFDEATSALDSISESKIQRAIENSFEGRTAFIIAHRLSTIRNADHIIVFDKGKIIEQGDFDTLIKLDAHFAKLWNMQSR
ncbi:MAG: ATP-binding cassette domain-containing protein, partial [Pseudomonadota bacterium]